MGPNRNSIAHGAEGTAALAARFAGALPRFDLVLVALADFDPDTGRYFATLTPPVIRNAARVLVVAHDASADAIRRRIVGAERVMAGDPVQLLRPAEGDVAVVAASAADSPRARHDAGAETPNTPKGEAPCSRRSKTAC